MKLVALLRLVNPNSFALIDSEIFIHVTLLEFFHCLANSSFTCGSSFTIKMMYGYVITNFCLLILGLERLSQPLTMSSKTVLLNSCNNRDNNFSAECLSDIVFLIFSKTFSETLLLPKS